MANLTWQDLQNQGYNPGGIEEAQAQHQTPDQFKQQEDQAALAYAIQAGNPGSAARGYYSGDSFVQTSPATPGMSMNQAMNIAKSYTGGGSGQQQQTQMGSGVDQANFLGNLGTLGLRSALGTNQIPVATNPQPSGSGSMSIGGVNNVASPSYSMPSNQALQQSLFGGTGKEQISGVPGIFTSAASPQATTALQQAKPTQTTAIQPITPATAAQPSQISLPGALIGGANFYKPGAAPAAPGPTMVYNQPAPAQATPSPMVNYTSGEPIGASAGGGALAAYAAAYGGQPKKMQAGGQVTSGASRFPANLTGMTGADLDKLLGINSAQANQLQGPAAGLPMGASPQQINAQLAQAMGPPPGGGQIPLPPTPQGGPQMPQGMQGQQNPLMGWTPQQPQGGPNPQGFNTSVAPPQGYQTPQILSPQQVGQWYQQGMQPQAPQGGGQVSTGGPQPGQYIPQGWNPGPGGSLMGALPQAPRGGPSPQGFNTSVRPPQGYQAPQILSPQQVAQWYQQGMQPQAPQEQRMATGGSVRDTDTVPAMLTPGEYVINRAAAERIGKNKLDQMNHPQHFKAGGDVGAVPALDWRNWAGGEQVGTQGPAPNQGGDRAPDQGGGQAQDLPNRTVTGHPKANWQYGAPPTQQPSTGWAAAPQMTMQQHDWMTQRPAGYGDTQPQLAQPGSQGHPYYGTPFAYGTKDYADYWNAAYGKGDPFGSGGPWNVAKMASGGSVDDQGQPREVPKAMSTDGSGGAAAATPQSAQQARQNANQTLNNLASNLGSGGGYGGGSNPMDIWRTAQMYQNMQGYHAGLTQNDPFGAGGTYDVTKAGPGGAGISPTAAVGAGVGALGSAISQAAQNWANSIGSWHMQPNAIPNPDQFRRNQPATSFGQMGT